MSCSQYYFHYYLDLSPLPFKINPFIMGSKGAKTGQNTRTFNSFISVVFKSFFLNLYPLWPWPLTFKINNFHPFSLNNIQYMSKKFDRDAQGQHVRDTCKNACMHWHNHRSITIPLCNALKGILKSLQVLLHNEAELDSETKWKLWLIYILKMTNQWQDPISHKWNNKFTHFVSWCFTLK